MPSISICGRITLSLSDLAAFPALPRDEGEPVFAGPWEAQAFALAVRLSALRHFTWKEWTAVLAEELKAAAERGEPDDGTCYYHYWLVALERLVTAKGLFDSAELLAGKEAWADAYQHAARKAVGVGRRRAYDKGRRLSAIKHSAIWPGYAVVVLGVLRTGR